MIIVQRLREIQNRHGYLPDAELTKLARLTGVPLYRVQEVASYFAAFRQEWDKPAVVEVRVCRDMACHHAGAPKLLHERTGLPVLGADPGINALLAAAAPGWAAAAGHDAPEPDRCRVAVEGVSCLGRCDRAPAVWVERHPMPRHEHAWTYARREGESLDAFRAHLIASIRAIAGGKDPDPDPDTGYPPNTFRPTTDASGKGAYVATTRKHFPRSEPGHEPAATPAWDIDVYAARNSARDYRAVKMVADSLKNRRGLAPWPSKEEMKGRVAHRLEERREKIEKAVERAVNQTVERRPDMPQTDRDAKAADARNKEEDKAREELFIAEANEHLVKMKEAGLQGMGGAGMPAYQKWLDVWRAAPQDASGPPAKYIVCNGDESEPGTFKDRELLLRTPHLVVEGVILAGLMTGATAGYVFIRHEYHEQIHAVEEEIARAERLGACGADVYGTGVAFPVAVFESPGGYICGEQSALIEAMEDHRAQPRNRPPDLQTNGLWDRPTVVNNVETLAWAPSIVVNGGAGYAGGGYKVPADDLPPGLKKVEFAGKRLFSISGDVARPGVYEVPIGIPLRTLVEDGRYCGGVTGRRAVKAVATSGPSGGLLPAAIPIDVPALTAALPALLAEIRQRPGPDGDRLEWLLRRYVLPKGALEILDLPLDLNVFRNVNRVVPFKVGGGFDRDYPEVMLGAGVVVYAEGTDTFDTAVNFSQFFRNESCGKCVPCRIGSHKITQLGTDLLARRNARDRKPDEALPAAVRELAANVPELAKAMKMTSICALGAVAPAPIWSALEYFPDEALTRPVPPARRG